jgi:hypothetical protein
MTDFTDGELDLLSRAFYAALDRLDEDARDPEETKSVLMTGIMGAAKAGERDEGRLVQSALQAFERFEQESLV